MSGSVTIVFDEDTPPLLRHELQSIANEVEDCLEVIKLPPIVVRMDCSFATSKRNFAGVITDNVVVMHLCPDLASQPISRIRGIFYHEMGHVLQFIEKQLRGTNLQDGRDYEQDCDYKVEIVCGIKIFYDSKMIQRVGKKQKGWIEKRPRGLK
jgi:hypothetical protein